MDSVALANSSPFSNEVYKELSRINGRINQMNIYETRNALAKHHLSTEGCVRVLKKRLKEHYADLKLSKVNLQASRMSYSVYVVVDFEATCEDHNPVTYMHEIIEFPAILIDMQTRTIVDTFHAYCRPVLNPKLSAFCSQLTGINQARVDKAETFPYVLERFNAWLERHNLVGPGRIKSCVVTDGHWDMAKFLYGQCQLTLKEMLLQLGMEFEGKPHCGLDDARNITRVLLQVAADRGRLLPNQCLNLSEESGNSIYNIYYNRNGEKIRTAKGKQQV